MKNILILFSIFTAKLCGMDINKEYVHSVVKHIFKSQDSSSVLYTVLLNTQNPTTRWQIYKNKKTNNISCQAIHTIDKDGLLYDTPPEDLPLEYFALIEQKYIQQQQSK